jgi:alanine-glyoxylate transaminase/serine-glyoxylate transaminase/serine-pyruvate transaminase
LGPLAGRVWRVGLMGAGSTIANVTRLLTALEHVLRAAGHRSEPADAAVAAAEAAVSA